MKIVHAQTVLSLETLEKLKEITRRENTKDALSEAVEHYIQCGGTCCKRIETAASALTAARDYIAVRNSGNPGTQGEGILKQINSALAELEAGK